MVSKQVGFKTSKDKVEKLDLLVAEGKFNSKSDAMNTALVLLLDRYGKLGTEGE